MVVFARNCRVLRHKYWESIPPVFAPSKEISHEGQGLTAVEKIFNKNAVGVTEGAVLHAGSDVRVKVNIVDHRYDWSDDLQELSRWLRP